MFKLQQVLEAFMSGELITLRWKIVVAYATTFDMPSDYLTKVKTALRHDIR